MTFRIVDNVSNSITLFFIKLACSNPWINSEYFADKEAKPSTNTFDLLQGKWNSSFSINVGIEDTMDVFEVGVCVFDDKGHEWWKFNIRIFDENNEYF